MPVISCRRTILLARLLWASSLCPLSLRTFRFYSGGYRWARGRPRLHGEPADAIPSQGQDRRNLRQGGGRDRMGGCTYVFHVLYLFSVLPNS